MALDKAGLKSDLDTLYTATVDNADLSPAQAKELFLTRMADAIEKFVKTATVNYTGGLTSANGGVVTGTLNHTIS
ncbi:MAG: hypothetical protein H7289_07880 [Mucilaginibacter sp.]|nr:hypothetical protein [Mucilaginibacter sp.]